MSRKAKHKPKQLHAVREPNGRPSRQEDPKRPAPALIKRLALIRDARFGTSLGQLFAKGDISSRLFSAGEWWASQAAKYHRATAAPSPDPKSLSFDGSGRSEPPDPDSDAGRELAGKEREAALLFIDVHGFLIETGLRAGRRDVEPTVRDVCERGQWPAGVAAREALAIGLSAIAIYRERRVKNGG